MALSVACGGGSCEPLSAAHGGSETGVAPAQVTTVPLGALASSASSSASSSAGPTAIVRRPAPEAPLSPRPAGLATATATVAAEPGHWAFPGANDDFSPKAALDLRYLNEKHAGQHGFIRVDDAGDFVRGDGRPIRFWAVGSHGFGDDVGAWAEHGRWLAKRGVNMARWHGNLAPKSRKTPLASPDRTAMAELWAFVAGMKRAGVYTTASFYYPHATRKQPNWGFDSRGMTGLLFFEPRLQAAYKQWLRTALSETNPHTGLALKDDPALAILQLQNEDSLLHWTAEGIAGRERRQLEARFFAFVRDKHGSLEAATAAWHGERAKGDATGDGRLQVLPLWELTRKAADKGQSVGKRARLADQMAFLTLTMRDFFADTIAFLRDEVGAPQLVNTGNWKTADHVTMMDAERFAGSVGDVLATNRYVHGGAHVGERAKWAVVTGDRFEDASLLQHPLTLPLALKQVARRAMIVSESNWVPPMTHQAEGPFLVSTYGALTGVDGFYWFTHGSPNRQFRAPSSANGHFPSLGKWVAGTPLIAGGYPAAALAYRQGYVRRGHPVVMERRSLKDLMARRPPAVSEGASFDPNRDRGRSADSETSQRPVDPLAFLVGPVLAAYSEQPERPSQQVALAPYIDEGRVRSNTGELSWDYRRGLVTLDAPHAQGAAGFFDGLGSLALSNITLAVDNDYGAFWAVSLDTKPLADSRHILLQAATRAHATGFRTAPDTSGDSDGKRPAKRILDHGRAPWQVAETRATLTIANPKLTVAVALDTNGMPTRALPLTSTPAGKTLRMPTDAMYVILRGGQGPREVGQEASQDASQAASEDGGQDPSAPPPR